MNDNQKCVKIKVTRKDIVNGKMGSESCCPIALALNRELPGHFWRVGFAWAYMTLSELGCVFRYIPLSRRAKQFISKFDKGITVKPFTFVVRLKKGREYE